MHNSLCFKKPNENESLGKSMLLESMSAERSLDFNSDKNMNIHSYTENMNHVNRSTNFTNFLNSSSSSSYTGSLSLHSKDGMQKNSCAYILNDSLSSNLSFTLYSSPDTS